MSIFLIYEGKVLPMKTLAAHIFAKIKCHAVAKLEFSIKKVVLNSYG